MRFSHALIVVSAGVFGTAVAVPQQQEPLAEAQFKNIKSFTGSKASDVIPAMQFMSASLGTDCDFCHTEDRASDEKHAKVVAREMIAMQRDINAKNFQGRNQVTCATCHAGRINPVSMPPVEGLGVRARRNRGIAPAVLIAGYGKGVGGDGSSIKGLRLQGTDVVRGEKTKLDATYAGEKFALVMHGAKGDVRQGFNGTMAWFTTPHGIQPVPLVFAAQYVNQKSLFTGPASLPKLDGSGGATAIIGKRGMLVVIGQLHNASTRVTLYFDGNTGLLARSQFAYPTILGNMLQTNDFSDYKKINGVQIPMTISSHSSEGDDVMHFTSATVDDKIPDGFFDPPKS